MIANSPLPPRSRAASSIERVPMPSGVAWLTKKSRASGLGVGVPGHHLDAALPRLAQHGRDAGAILDRDRDHIDPAGDPALDQLVLLGGVEVGRAVPDELDAELPARLPRRPSRQLTK